MSHRSGDQESDNDNKSDINEGSVISTVPDRYGFLGGNQYNPDRKLNISPEIIKKREQKWLEMFDNWERIVEKTPNLIKKRCRKGIPQSVRARAWMFLTRAKHVMDQNKGVYNHLLSETGDLRCIEDIRKDLHRQFPTHEMFYSEEGHGQRDLFDILRAYSIKNPHDGYCQGQAPIAAFLLMHMPAEEAFWCLVLISEKYLSGYYSYKMEALQVDGDILFALLKKKSPEIYKHLEKQKIEPTLYMTDWFLCVYTRTLPWNTLLRVWDIFLFEGVNVLFKVAIILIKAALKHKSSSTLKKHYPTMYETIPALRNPDFNKLREEKVIDGIVKSGITEDQIQYEARQVRIRRIKHNQRYSNTR